MTSSDLKRSILQLAISGKLVPRIASEGAGEELLEQIRREREKSAACRKGKSVGMSAGVPAKRVFENVPMTEQIDDLFEREARPSNPDVWIDKTKTKVGYEIPFTPVFYVYRELESAKEIEKRIQSREDTLQKQLRTLFAKGR